MSQDDGTYIIQTAGPEFRIAQLPAVDNLFEEYKPESSSWSPNINYIVDSFKYSEVFTNLETAWDAAATLDNDKPTEYGANLITDFSNYHFSDLVEKHGKLSVKTA